MSIVWQIFCYNVFSYSFLRPFSAYVMGLLPDTSKCGLRMCRECRERFPRHWLQRKPLVSNPGMHHDTGITHVPWCMSGSLTRGGRENGPGIPGACETRNLYIYIYITSMRLGWTKTYVRECINNSTHRYYIYIYIRRGRVIICFIL